MSTTLEGRWRQWTSGLGEERDREKWWTDITKYYTEPTRRYHTLRHLEAMFLHFDRLLPQLTRPRLVALAIFFHDLIYNPKSGTNEEDSAAQFQSFAQEVNMAKEEASMVVEWILATKSHAITPSQGDEDLPLFLDMDMSILGVDTPDYMVYASQIREEYIHVPHEAYCQGRATVLTTFLQQPRIYASQTFYTDMEDKARHNIQEEIKLLTSGTIPS